MADNPYVNKVVYGTTPIIDLTSTTATEEDVAAGKVFYKASGERAVGTANSDVAFIKKTVARNTTLTVRLYQNSTGVIFYGGASSTRRGIASYGTNASGNALCTELVDATDITITTNNTPSFTITNGGSANAFLLFMHYNGDEPTFP